MQRVSARGAPATSDQNAAGKQAVATELAFKALQYMARRFYAPLIISGVEDLERGTAAIHVTGDRQHEEPGEVRWLVTRVNGQALADGSRPLVIPAQADLLVEDLKRCIDYFKRNPVIHQGNEQDSGGFKHA